MHTPFYVCDTVGEVKNEVKYLFDLLTTETYTDENIGCQRSLRLCVFIDDLDRCPRESVVSVLEAVILLLVDGPITVWMAIDSRLVVQCIEAVKEGVFDKANISGHEFLDKIVQLPFALPLLPYDTKMAYAKKIIEDKELDPERVLARFKREGLYEKLNIKADECNTDKGGGNFAQLVQLACKLEKLGKLKHRNDRKAMLGVSEVELINAIAKNPQGASAEQRENLCVLIGECIYYLSSGKKPDEYPQGNDETSGLQPSVIDGIPPPPGVYIPMLEEEDRECLKGM